MHLEDSCNRYLKKAAQSRTPVSQGQYITNNVVAPHQLPGDIQVPSTNNNGTGRPSKRTRIEGQEDQENGQDASCSEREKSRSKVHGRSGRRLGDRVRGVHSGAGKCGCAR
ncbi:hypothetical protein M422DRAFT_265490 [Sphaerobolus stellatus SS14]|uniref:Uncharacterized protein n=1 Tax=Sphaerobolus stellatus (strain SS14) TaxID=990650 RepID=A0A0C9V527_SPHS4|nr:hypothetical protein M422DRAFT_265490 [Sphaerobolus stellatus SS14]